MTEQGKTTLLIVIFAMFCMAVGYLMPAKNTPPSADDDDCFTEGRASDC